MIYNVDFGKWVQQNLPWVVRKPAMVAWLTRLLAPLSWLHGQFLAFTTATRYDYRITGQVRSLRFHMNRVFDPSLSRIAVLDGQGGDSVFVFLENENNPVYLPQFVTKPGVDFVVAIPYGMDGQIPAMRQFIDRYRLPTKNYEFQFTGDPNIS
jgi:hypothetical protein